MLIDIFWQIEGLVAQEKLKTHIHSGSDGLVAAVAFNLVAAGLGHLKVVDSQQVSLHFMKLFFPLLPVQPIQK
jgi:hypothetical protein